MFGVFVLVDFLLLFFVFWFIFVVLFWWMELYDFFCGGLKLLKVEFEFC